MLKRCRLAARFRIQVTAGTQRTDVSQSQRGFAGRAMSHRQKREDQGVLILKITGRVRAAGTWTRVDQNFPLVSFPNGWKQFILFRLFLLEFLNIAVHSSLMILYHLYYSFSRKITFYCNRSFSFRSSHKYVAFPRHCAPKAEDECKT